MSAGMSILDYTTGLFREPASLGAFVDDPRQALRDAGFPEATPEQVLQLLPVIAESMPLDHPLQAVAHADDPAAALRAIDVADLIADAHDHHREVALIEKALGGPESFAAPQPQCAAPQGEAGPVIVVDVGAVEPADVGSEKGLGGPLDAPSISDDEAAPLDDNPSIEEAASTVAGLLEQPDVDAAAWGTTLE